MKHHWRAFLLVPVVTFCWILLGSWRGPIPDCKNDSVAIVRVVTPIGPFFEQEPVVYASKGLCNISEVHVTDGKLGRGQALVGLTLSGFLSKGYRLQTEMERTEDGLRVNTYYLKKRNATPRPLETAEPETDHQSASVKKVWFGNFRAEAATFFFSALQRILSGFHPFQ